MASGKFRLAGAASQDIDDIWDYVYASSFSIAVADQVLQRIYESFDLLGENPLAGHFREDLTTQNLRFWSVYQYLIVYRPGQEPIEILAILHSARDVETILERNRGSLKEPEANLE